MPKYDFQTLKNALLFNTVEVLPTDYDQFDQELRVLVEKANQSGERIRHYIGFEISGQIHIGTGMPTALKIKKLQEAGVKCSIFLADYHTFLNEKLDGKIETIRKVAREYFAPVMLKCCEVMGCDTADIDIVFAEDLYDQKNNNQSFFSFILKTSKELSLNRVLKSVSIMGKDAGEGVDFGTLQYPVMQVCDAFFMQTHIVHAGMDQRKVHVLMRETASKLDAEFALRIGGEKIKPIAVHHSLLLGLEKPEGLVGEDQNAEVKVLGVANNASVVELGVSQSEFEEGKITKQAASKMSKSRPDSAIWVHDSVAEIERKIKKAYCPMPKIEQSREEVLLEQELNPILDWSKNLIYPAGQKVALNRPEKFGGNRLYETYQELEQDYFAVKIHPLDLKSGVANCLVQWFEPIRDFVEQNPKGLDLVKSSRK